MEYCEKQKKKKEIRALVYENNQSEDTSTTSGPLISVLLQFDDVHPVTWGKRSLFVLILNNDSKTQTLVSGERQVQVALHLY